MKNGWKQLNEFKTAIQTFDQMDNALLNLGYSDESRNLIYQWIAAILHIGNIKIIEDDDGNCKISESSMRFLNDAAILLNVDNVKLQNALLFRHINGAKEVYVHL